MKTPLAYKRVPMAPSQRMGPSFNRDRKSSDIFWGLPLQEYRTPDVLANGRSVPVSVKLAQQYQRLAIPAAAGESRAFRQTVHRGSRVPARADVACAGVAVAMNPIPGSRQRNWPTTCIGRE